LEARLNCRTFKTLIFSCLLLVVSCQLSVAGMVTHVDTLRPTYGGNADEWTGNYLDIDEAERDDDSTYISANAAGLQESWLCMASGGCPANWVYIPMADTVKISVWGRITIPGPEVIFGQCENLESRVNWCYADTQVLTLSYAEYIWSIYGDSCNDSSWSAYRLATSQWGVESYMAAGWPKGGYARGTQSYLVAYWDFSDSAEILTVSASLCSTWTVFGCDDVAGCLTSQVCGDIRTDTKDEIQAWRMSTYSNPSGTKVDSIEGRLTGFVVDDNQDSLTVFYAIESGGTCTKYGVDTIPDLGPYSNFGGPEHSVVWSTCPATGVAWTVSDLTDPNKGFGVVNLHNSHIVASWFVVIVYYSAAEAAAGQVIIISQNFHRPKSAKIDWIMK